MTRLRTDYSRLVLLLPFAFLLAATQSIEMSNDVAREVYQAQASAICHVDMAQTPAGGFEPGYTSRGCECVVEQLMTGKSLAQLPSISTGTFRSVARDELASCLDRMKKSAAGKAVDRAPGSEALAGIEAVPLRPVPTAAPAEAAGGGSGTIGDRIAAWMDYLPLLVGGLIALAVLLIIFRRFGGEGGRDDLSAVPPSMRPSLPPQTRRPDLPRD